MAAARVLLLALLAASSSLAAAAAPVLFGALLGAYLWVLPWPPDGVTRLGALSSVTKIAALGILTVVSGGAFFASFYVALVSSILPEMFPALASSSQQGPGPTAFFLSGIFGATVVSSVFLVLLPSPWTGKRLYAAIAVSAGAGGVLALIGSAFEGHSNSGLLPLIWVWQGGMALVLSTLAELHAWWHLPASPSDGEPDPLALA